MRKSWIAEMAVGGFLVVGFLAFAFLALHVSGLDRGSVGDSYTVTARFDNVGGLTERARVSMGGVTIGRVSSIKLDQQDFMAVVEMQIDNQFNQITADATARILTAGVLGEKYIGLSAGADDIALGQGDEIEYTQSSLVLEDLIAKFLVNQAESE